MTLKAFCELTTDYHLTYGLMKFEISDLLKRLQDVPDTDFYEI